MALPVIVLLILSGLCVAAACLGFAIVIVAGTSLDRDLDLGVDDPADDAREYSQRRLLAEAEAVVRIEQSRLLHPSMFDQDEAR